MADSFSGFGGYGEDECWNVGLELWTGNPVSPDGHAADGAAQRESDMHASTAARTIFLPIATLLVVSTVAADGLIVIDDPTVVAPPTGHYRFAPLEVRYHHVTAKITDQVAVTEIDQVFFNPNPRPLEGTYVFPLPPGAQIDRFAMDIDGRLLEAELLDAAKARDIYEDIVRRMKDPALLEYAGQGMFKARVFPIEPYREKRVTIRYTEVLTSDGGLVEYRYPLNTEKFSAQPLESVSVKVTIECTRGLSALYSPSHEVDISRPGEGRAVVGYEATNVRPDTDFQLFYSPATAGPVGLDLVTFKRPSEDGYFLLLATPAPSMTPDQVIAKDVVFVLDTSGSMADRGKLDQAEKALSFCLANLNPGDRFEVIRFATEAEAMFTELMPADGRHLEQARDFVDRLRPIGGTAIEQALNMAIELAPARAGRDRPFVIVFLTDGRPTVGETDTERLVHTILTGIDDREIRVFCFGIGTDVNTHLLDRVTEKTRAVSQYVLPEEDIELKVSRFYTKINHPVLANPKLRFGSGIRASLLQPSTLPELFKGEQLVVLGRYRGSGDAAITLEGTVNGEQRSFTYEGSFTPRSAEHDFVARLWATRRVGFLLDEIRLHGESRELRDEVTSLAREYGIVTPYTAYLIVEDERSREVPVADRTLQIIDQDRGLLEETRRVYSEANELESGDAAVGGAQAYGALKVASKMAAPSEANRHAQRGQTGAAAEGGRQVQQAIQSQESRYLRGRTFYRNGESWIDANVQTRAGATKVKVKFNSEKYFELMIEHPEAAAWLSLGQQVQLQLGDTIYDIVAE